MGRDGLTGSRIRERRVIAGFKQADLARHIGISASYLNLIEHNRRRIGGKLLLDIARSLDVEPSALTEGAEAALIAALREAGQGAALVEAEMNRAEDFAGRFPGWADVLVAAHRRVGELERTVEILSDRLAQDPQLAASVHEVLTTAAAIRSTAAILAEDQDLPPEWQKRFHTNMDQDSRRLAESSKALAQFLDTAGGAVETASTPLEEVEAFFAARAYDISEITEDDAALTDVIAEAPELRTAAARRITQKVLGQLWDDYRQTGATGFHDAVARIGADPLDLAGHFGTSVAPVLRRMAVEPTIESGLVICDRAGGLLLRKPIEGFDIPRHGAACPLWPLFHALAKPGQVISEHVQHLGRSAAEFRCFAVAEPTNAAGYNDLPLYQATMLILPASLATEDASASVRIGAACRICPKEMCHGRREPSILSDGL